MMKEMEDYAKSAISRVQAKHGFISEQVYPTFGKHSLRRMKLRKGPQLDEE